MQNISIKDLCPPNFDDLLFDILDHRHTHYKLKGGRGSTKSTFIGWVLPLLLTQNPNTHGIVFRKTANTLRDSVFMQIQAGIGMLGLSEYFSCTVSPMKVTYKPTGQTIIFRGVDDKMKLKSIKAPFGYFAFTWLEECDTFSGMEEIRNILQSVMRGGDKFWVFYSFNPPVTAANFMNEDVLIQREDTLVHHSTYLTVPSQWLGPQFIYEAEQLKALNPKAYAHDYLGEVTGSGGQVFDNLSIRTIEQDEINRFDRLYFGVDWGWFPDPFQYVKMHYDASRLTLYIFDEYRCNKKSNRETADILIQQKGITYNNKLTCDSAEQKSIGDYKSYGLFARGAIKGPGSVEYGMKWLQSLSSIVIDPNRCPNVASEFSKYEYEMDKDGKPITGYPDRDNHTIDAVRYAMEEVWRRKGQ